jgi:hypothetical protein
LEKKFESNGKQGTPGIVEKGSESMRVTGYPRTVEGARMLRTCVWINGSARSMSFTGFDSSADNAKRSDAVTVRNATGILTRKDELTVSLQDLTPVANDMVMGNDDQ